LRSSAVIGVAGPRIEVRAAIDGGTASGAGGAGATGSVRAHEAPSEPAAKAADESRVRREIIEGSLAAKYSAAA
jgi:hypothetical protein